MVFSTVPPESIPAAVISPSVMPVKRMKPSRNEAPVRNEAKRPTPALSYPKNCWGRIDARR